MDVWNLFLYVVASVLALKSLASLMTHHKKIVVKQLAIEYTQEADQDGNLASQSTGPVQPEANDASDKVKEQAA